jgi:hypothetical protein
VVARAQTFEGKADMAIRLASIDPKLEEGEGIAILPDAAAGERPTWLGAWLLTDITWRDTDG